MTRTKDGCIRGLRFTLVAAAAITGGCTTSHRTYLAGGQAGYAISCSAMTVSWSSCLVKAGRLCRRSGYTVAYSDEIDRKLFVHCGERTVAFEEHKNTP